MTWHLNFIASKVRIADLNDGLVSKLLPLLGDPPFEEFDFALKTISKKISVQQVQQRKRVPLSSDIRIDFYSCKNRSTK